MVRKWLEHWFLASGRWARMMRQIGTLPPSRAASRRAWDVKESVRIGWRLRRWEKATEQERWADSVRACRVVSLA